MSMAGTVGTVSTYNELRLEEVPEMGYNPLGNPPRGEICLRGKSIFTEYHKNPELTKEAFKDGWFHTGSVQSHIPHSSEQNQLFFVFVPTFASSTWKFSGDIGEMLPNGTVKIIDRKKNLIKLSQGEYVALEYLENVYAITPIVEDVSKLMSLL